VNVRDSLFAALRLRPRKPVPTAREEADAWLAWLKLDGMADSTIEGYRAMAYRFLDRWPDLALAEFTDEHILGFIEEANPASRQQQRGCFSNLFGWAYRTRRIPVNPMHHVQTYKQTKRDPIDVFTEAECKILCALPGPDGTLMDLMLGSGMRKSEARNLSVRRVDLEHAELHIVEGAKGSSAGVVPLEHRLVQRLAEYFLLEGLNETDFLWYSHPGGSKDRRHDRPLSNGALHLWWTRCVEQAGVPYRNLHVTRHTYATNWRRRGLQIDDVGDLLRHADPRTTKRVYTHFKAIDLRQKIDALSGDDARERKSHSLVDTRGAS
jgi:integrase